MTFQPVPDAATRIADLRTGKADVARGLNADDTVVLKNDMPKSGGKALDMTVSIDTSASSPWGYYSGGAVTGLQHAGFPSGRSSQ